MSKHIVCEKTQDTDYRYFDMNGNEIFAGDYIKDGFSGKIRQVYLSEDRQLGIDATNPAWIMSGRAVPCEYGLYPLEEADMECIVLHSRENG